MSNSWPKVFRDPVHNLVAFGYQVFRFDIHIRERGDTAHVGHLAAFETGRQSWHLVVGDEVSGDDLVESIQLVRVMSFPVTLDHHFVLFG